MTKHRRHAGFTLIELLIVVVIIGILVAVAIPKFSETRGKAYAASLKADLSNLATQQELFYESNHTYTSSLTAASMTPSRGVILTITAASPTGWSATTTHPSASPLVCGVFYGNAAPVAPATNSGAIKCQ